MKYTFLALSTIAFGLFSCSNENGRTTKLDYPVAEKGGHVDEYFGTSVEDPYKWLEDDESEATAQWIKAENEVTFGYLDQIDFRGQIKSRIEELMDYRRVTAPFEEGDYEYYYENEGLQNHSVLYRRLPGAEDNTEVYIDPNLFSEDGTIGLRGVSFTKDGSLSAHMITDGGSDWRKVITMNATTREVIEDTLIDVKFSGLSWYQNDGFYYSSYDKPEEGSQLSGKTQLHKLYYHKLGTPPGRR